MTLQRPQQHEAMTWQNVQIRWSHDHSRPISTNLLISLLAEQSTRPTRTPAATNDVAPTVFARWRQCPGGVAVRRVGCTRNGPLGLISGEVSDSQMSASSIYPASWDAGCHERHGRLYRPNGLAWCAKTKSASEWLQVDLGVPTKVRTSTTR